MTLMVYVTYTDEVTGETKDVDLGPGGYMAGVEIARTELWGAYVMYQLELKIIPHLAHGNIHVSGEELDDLEREANIILANMDKITRKVRFDESTISQRTNNILNAIRKAREVNGTLTIA